MKLANSLSKLKLTVGVPSASKWSAYISRMSFSSVIKARNALIYEEDLWPFKSFQNSFSSVSPAAHSFFTLSISR